MRAAFGTAEATCVVKQVYWACNELMTNELRQRPKYAARVN